MKIEKVSNSQIKVYLSTKDLEERNLQLSELAYSSDKTRELFREFMEMAVEEFDFHADNIPLMIEAIPMANDEIVLIVSKVSSESEGELNISMIPSALGERLFAGKEIEDLPQKIVHADSDYIIYSMEALDHVSALARRIIDSFEGDSALYKYKGEYYLIMSKDFSPTMSIGKFESIASEYGTRHISAPVTKIYLKEYGETIVENNAIEVMSRL